MKISLFKRFIKFALLPFVLAVASLGIVACSKNAHSYSHLLTYNAAIAASKTSYVCSFATDRKACENNYEPRYKDIWNEVKTLKGFSNDKYDSDIEPDTSGKPGTYSGTVTYNGLNKATVKVAITFHKATHGGKYGWFCDLMNITYPSGKSFNIPMSSSLVEVNHVHLIMINNKQEN